MLGAKIIRTEVIQNAMSKGKFCRSPKKERTFRTGTINGSVAIYKKLPMGLSSPIKIQEYTARSIKSTYSIPKMIFTVDTSK